MKRESLFIFALAVLLLSGCGPSAPVPVTEINQIVGTWRSDPPGTAIRINPDGSVLQALTVGTLDGGEYEELSLVFEEGFAIISGHPHGACETGSTGSYMLQILTSGNLEVAVLDDGCAHRIEHLLDQEVAEDFIRVE